MMKLDRPLCVFDLEATGVDVNQDRIVEICVLRLEPGGQETLFESLVDPGAPIPPEATAVHKITNDMVRGQPTIKDLAPKILDVFEGADVSGFNAVKFDVPMLRTRPASRRRARPWNASTYRSWSGLGQCTSKRSR